MLVTVTETSIPPPAPYFDWSPIYEIAPACVSVFAGMTALVPFSNLDGAIPNLAVFHAKDRQSPFNPLTNVIMNAGFIQVGIPEPGLYFVGRYKSASQMSCP